MVRAATQAEQFDRNQDYRKHDSPGRRNPAFDQRLTVAALVGECESIVGAGVLTEPAERSLRLLIARTLVSFDMPAKGDREPA